MRPLLPPRALRMARMTLRGLARRAIVIPYRYADSLPAPGAIPAYPAAEAALGAARGRFADLLRAADALSADLEAIGAAPPPAPRWTQDWFPALDAAAAYLLVRGRRPARIVEVGSGHSTRFLARAVADGRLATAVTAIDPAPRAGLAGLPVRLVRATLGAVDPAVFDDLAAGDMLFIDSSHILVPGSDVDVLLNRVLPRLPAGCLVHVHDVFLPDDYPADWAWRGYNEQNGVAPLLQAGWVPLFASHYVATRMSEALAASAIARLPAAPGARPASLWLEKR
jgi:hypothetical protein